MNQNQSEALLSLAILAIFTDSMLSLKEEEALSTAVESIGWQSTKPRDIFVLTTMSRARAASQNDAATQTFIHERAAAFTDDESRKTALSTLQAVLGSDGVSAEESKFLGTVKAAFQA
ncbi:MAG TPA: hypothetical protein VF585_10195 [Chthoniobacterales bacterium]|jgi:hypothetical protein